MEGPSLPGCLCLRRESQNQAITHKIYKEQHLLPKLLSDAKHIFNCFAYLTHFILILDPRRNTVIIPTLVRLVEAQRGWSGLSKGHSASGGRARILRTRGWFNIDAPLQTPPVCGAGDGDTGEERVTGKGSCDLKQGRSLWLLGGETNLHPD